MSSAVTACARAHSTRISAITTHKQQVLHPVEDDDAERGRADLGRPREADQAHALGADHDERQLMDIVFTVGQYRMLAGALNSFGVQLDEEIARAEAERGG